MRPHSVDARKRNGRWGGKFQGWRFGLALWALVAWIFLLLSVGYAVYVWKKFYDSRDGGIVRLYQGDCSYTRKRRLAISLLVNVMSAAFLSGSNYTMQCMASPSRKELDTAHAKGDRMEIGVPSIRNLLRGQIAWSRRVACVLLAACTLPMHFLFNSVVFETRASNTFGTFYGIILSIEGVYTCD